MGEQETALINNTASCARTVRYSEAANPSYLVQPVREMTADLGSAVKLAFVSMGFTVPLPSLPVIKTPTRSANRWRAKVNAWGGSSDKVENNNAHAHEFCKHPLRTAVPMHKRANTRGFTIGPTQGQDKMPFVPKGGGGGIAHLPQHVQVNHMPCPSAPRSPSSQSLWQCQ